MQKLKLFKYLTSVFQIFLITSFIVALLQNYLTRNGYIELFGIELHQFYKHSELRIIPLIFASFYLISIVKRFLRLEGEFYFSEFLIALICSIDAFTHINGFYSTSYNIIFFETIWFDKVMHFMEGLIFLPAFLPLAIRFTSKSKRIFSNPRLWAYFIVIGGTSIFFIIWEIIELFIDKSLGITLLVTGQYDTNEDLAFAYFGFIFAAITVEVFMALDEIYSFEQNIKKFVSRVKLNF